MDASISSSPLSDSCVRRTRRTRLPAATSAPSQRRPWRHLWQRLVRRLRRQERRLALMGLLLAQVLLVLFYGVLSEHMARARQEREQAAQQLQALRSCELLSDRAARARCGLQGRQTLQRSAARGR